MLFQKLYSLPLFFALTAPLGCTSCETPPPEENVEGEECQRITLGPVVLDAAQDVQTLYSAPLLEPLGDGRPDALVFNFVNYNERFGTLAVGGFSLAEPPNDNRATCPECVSVFSDQLTLNSEPEKVFFQRSGHIELLTDPRSLVFKALITGLVLEEVTLDDTLWSTPVENGACLRVDDFEVDFKVVPDAWTCDPRFYNAQDGCQCDCGVIDPDCSCDPFANPDCPAVIEDDCPASEVCTATGCQPQCSLFETPKIGCDTGELCILGDAGERCVDEQGWINAAALGQECLGFGNRIEYCAVLNSIPQGLCDDFDATCRPLCQGENSCAPDQRCFTLVGGGPENGGSGYCRPAGGGSEAPPQWTCVNELYDDAIACDCGCGAGDPDCLSGELEVRGCGAGQMCNAAGECQ